MAKTCQICGKYSGFYPLCNACFKLRDEGEVIKCEDCGKWHYADDRCDCQATAEAIEREENIVIAETTLENTIEYTPSNCILCNDEVQSFLFCKKCYQKYRNKELLIKITRCSRIELLDDSYEGKYVCIDGHVVKSKSERDIDNYLFRHKIAHAYEKAYTIDEHAEHDLHPDFYLPELDLYIEHWGFDENNQRYTKEKKYKIDIYRREGLTVICTDEKRDAGDIETALDRKLKTFKRGEINFL